MPTEVNVTTDPLIVYGLVGLLLGAIVLTLLFSRPRRDLGAVKRSDVPKRLPADEPWMPGGDIFGRDAEPTPPAVDEMPALPVAPPVVATPSAPPAVPDPWSTGASDPTGAPPPSGKR